MAGAKAEKGGIAAAAAVVPLTEIERDILADFVGWLSGYHDRLVANLVEQLIEANKVNQRAAETAAASGEVEALAAEVAAELARAITKHGPMRSAHEGWSVILEELEELRDHVRADTGRGPEARKEALQIAAMGLRYAMDLCGGGADGA